MARNKIRQEVISINAKLNEKPAKIYKADIECVKKNYFPHIATRQGKHKLHCLDCGADWQITNADSNHFMRNGNVTCPHCGKVLKVDESSKKRIFTTKAYLQRVENIGEFQVVRTFLSYLRTGNEIELVELQRYFIDANGNEFVCSKRHAMYYNWYGNFQMDSEINIKDISRFDCVSFHCWRAISIQPWLKQRGFSANDKGSVVRLIWLLMTNVAFETMWKTGYKGLALVYADDIYDGHRNTYYKTMKVAMRHGATYLKDYDKAKMWFDLIQALNYLKKDLRNPKFVAPQNLKEAHDYWDGIRKKKQAEERDRQERLARMERHERQIKEAKRNKRDVEAFNYRIQFFKDLQFNAGNLIIKPILTVDDMIEEGKINDNCVGGYWRDCHSYSLIFVGATKEGKHHTTIEVRLTDFKVPQCYEKHNSDSPYLNTVRAVLEDNPLIKRCANQYVQSLKQKAI